MIPTTTAKTTLPEAPGFFSWAGAIPLVAGEAGVGTMTGMAGVGVETISTRALREAGIGASGITIVSVALLGATLLEAAFLAAAFFGALDATFFLVAFLTADFFTTDFFTADFFTALFFAAVFFGFAADFFAVAFFATDFLAVAFFTATVTPRVAVRTLGSAHVWEKVTPAPQALRLPAVQLLEEIAPCGLSSLSFAHPTRRGKVRFLPEEIWGHSQSQRCQSAALKSCQT